MDLEEYRSNSHAVWDRIGVNWDAEREYIHSATRPVNERMVERADPEAGNTILDLAAGTGETGFLAMEAIGKDGKLISTDFAESMVDAARRGGEALGIEDAEYKVLDAEKMDLDDSSVDRVLCRFGYMLMADPAAALAETRRVLRDDGRLCFGVWGAPDDNQWAAIPGAVLVERGHIPPPEPGAPGIMAMADPARINELVTGAGFDEPEIEQVDVLWPYTDAGEHWGFTMKLAGPLADAVGRLDEDEREAVREEVASRIEPLRAPSGGVAGRVNVVTVA